MSEEQKTQSEPAGQYRQNDCAAGAATSRAQMRQERRMAKMAAKEQHHADRDSRRAARAARPRRDWTFEVRFGEKLYTFTWRWLTMGFDTQVTEPVTEPASTAQPSSAVQPEAEGPSHVPMGE